MAITVNPAMSLEIEADDSPATVTGTIAHDDALFLDDERNGTEQTTPNNEIGVARRNSARCSYSYQSCLILLAVAGSCAVLFRMYEPFSLVQRTDEDMTKSWNSAVAKTAKRENATLCPLKKYPDTLVPVKILNNSHVLTYPGAIVTNRKYFNCPNDTAKVGPVD
jgi:hypothetical protein